MRDRVATSDTIDVADVARTVRRQWRAVAWCVALGVTIAAGVLLFAPRRFDGKATVLARPTAQGGSSIAGRMSGGLGELLGGAGGLGSLTGSTMETELQVLRSRALIGQVVDSLLLQVSVRNPSGVASAVLVDSAHLPGAFAPITLTFRHQPDGRYKTTSSGRDWFLRPGARDSIEVGTLVLNGKLPEEFTLRLRDREDAITRASSRFTINKAGGDVARVVFRGDDSLSAALAANSLIKFYLDRRKTTDRGTNERRVEYVSAQLDSTRAALTQTESELRAFQERSGVLDVEIVGEVELQAAANLRRSLTELQVDEGAIKQLLAQADSGRLTSRDLAAYPAFIRGSSLSPLAQQLSELEAQRIRLLERRTLQDPEVRALDATIQGVQANILATARSYASSVTRQRQQMQARVDSIQARLLALPAAAERGGRLQRDVLRLTQIATALEAQLVEARLGVIGEGGEIKQVDVAVPQRKVAFPRPVLTMGIGTAGGLLAGLVMALFMGWFGRWLRDPVEIERAVGISAERFEPNAPLLLAGAASMRSMLVIPLDARARSRAANVADRLARTAQQRAIPATVLDLSNGNGTTPSDAQLQLAEQAGSMTVAHLPELTSAATLAAMRETRPVVLVAAPGPVDRSQLAHAVDTLRRLQVPCAGVVISDAPNPRALI
jgi:tyrosine-protein kinase Etk/Wzc